MVDRNTSLFPDPRQYDDIVALGNDLRPETLLDAYSHGIFPWPMDGMPALPWFCPDPRAVLVFSQIHIPRSLEKARKHSTLRFTLDQAFSRVIEHCAQSPRPGQDGTWITPEMLKAYVNLHEAGHAHSVEAWRDHELVGGLYGVDGGGVFAAESMFFLEPNASKLCLLFLVEHMRTRGLEWIDIQVMTPHLQALGATEIPRDDFLDLLARTQEKKLTLWGQ